MRKKIFSDVPRLSPHIHPDYYSVIMTNSGNYPYGLGVGYMANGDNYYDFQWETTTGFLAVKRPNGTVQIYSSSYAVFAGPGLAYVTFWSCASAVSSAQSGSVTYIDCNGYYFNGGFNSIDVRGLTTLESLTCYMNVLDTLQVTGCAALMELNCDNNVLGALDLTGCSSLGGLSCENCSLSLLNIADCAAMGSLYCPYNSLTELNLAGKPTLGWVECSFNDLSAPALNSMYTQLPVRTHGAGQFYRPGNPGAGSDNPSIATAKNWTVS